MYVSIWPGNLLLINNDEIIQQWLERCMHINKKVTFHYNDEIIHGLFKGIDTNGFAKIENENNKHIFSKLYNNSYFVHLENILLSANHGFVPDFEHGNCTPSYLDVLRPPRFERAHDELVHKWQFAHRNLKDREE